MHTYDVAIIGSGLTGSIVGLLLSKLGYSTLIVEKTAHPRFALGESSTPVFGQKIRHLGKSYDVPELVELSSYDRIKASELTIDARTGSLPRSPKSTASLAGPVPVMRQRLSRNCSTVIRFT